MSQKSHPPKGLVHQSKSLQAFQLATHNAPSDLAEVVDYFWTVTWDLAPGKEYVQANLPHPVCHIVVDPQQGSGFFTPARGAFSYRLSGRGGVLGARIKPGMARAFHPGSLAHLGTVPVALDGIDFGVLEDHLRVANAPNDIIPDFAQQLRNIAAPPCAVAKKTGALVIHAQVNPDILRAEALAQVAGMSLRQLQRLFSAHIGVGPKWVIDRFRMLEALAALNAGGHVDLADLSARLGFTDQPHFSARFKTLTGTSPARYLRAQGMHRA